ncbi:hypothetical protein V5799_010205 [Amblyomma americanum]|uniref:Carboxylesterase type B domain-containing protein n=1 Tax=Amblyomma americanum TaxID=6943 RepID=A0AAQ4F9S4_AMBAM
MPPKTGETLGPAEADMYAAVMALTAAIEAEEDSRAPPAAFVPVDGASPKSPAAAGAGAPVPPGAYHIHPAAQPAASHQGGRQFNAREPAGRDDQWDAAGGQISDAWDHPKGTEGNGHLALRGLGMVTDDIYRGESCTWSSDGRGGDALRCTRSSLMVMAFVLALSLALVTVIVAVYEYLWNLDRPVARGQFGAVRGQRIVVSDQGRDWPVFAFLGVPFAKAARGSLRFKPPLPLDRPLGLYDGRYLSALGNVVVVVPNYRVGALGFLSGPWDNRLQGNAGLHDQRLALEWTLTNIGSFGGNASLVVLAGHDAGASSLGFHLFSGDTDFWTRNTTRFILQSGGPFHRYEGQATEGARLLASSLRCPADLESDRALQCLQTASVDGVARSQLALAFAPVFNRAPLLRPRPREGLERSSHSKAENPRGLEFLLGRVGSEGSYPWFVTQHRTTSSDSRRLATRLLGQKALERWQTATGVTLDSQSADAPYQEAVGDVLVRADFLVPYLKHVHLVCRCALCTYIIRLT